MLGSFTKCINCGADEVGIELCPLCGVLYDKAEKVYFEKLKEGLRKEGYEQLATERQFRKEDELKEELRKEGYEQLATDRQLRKEDEGTFEFGSSPKDLVIIGIVLLLGIVLLFWSLGYLQ